ncbi:MAG TPA: hypothetical protein VJT31_22215 [Rugosimonospora sp.]|nr:hypothetical protein [Rugosimonospora sp.]
MTTIDVGNGDRLDFEPARDTLRMTPGIGGAGIELQLKVGRTTDSANPPRYRIDAVLDISRRSQQGRRRLCRLQTGHLITPAVRATSFSLHGFASDEQLRVAEELRAGGELWFNLTLDVWTVEEPAGLIGYTGYLDFPVTAGEWCTQLERVDGASLVEVLVPMPTVAEYAGAVHRLQQARALLRDNQIDAALGEARKALEPVLEAARDGGLAKGAQNKLPRERTLAERFAVQVEATFSLLSGAAHDDEVTKDFRYTRAEALALLATTAGLLNRLATQV